MFIILGTVIMLCVLLVCLLKCLLKVCPKIKKCYEFIKSKLLYGVLIRFVLLGTLKIQMTLGRPLVIGTYIPESETEKSPDLSATIIGLSAITLLSLSPILFAYVMCKNHSKLDETETKAKIGAMYYGLNTKRKRVSCYTVVFLLRRSFFIVVTFVLYMRPGLQVELMLYPTLAYICIISHLDVHETPR